MRWFALCALMAPLVACNVDQEFPGTGVGNPGEARVSLGSGDAVVFTRAVLPIDEVVYTSCDDGDVTEPEDRTVDLLAKDTLVVPTGTWCAVDVYTSGLVQVEGDGVYGGTFTLTLDVATVALDAGDGLVVDGDALVLELAHPLWVSALGLVLVPTTQVDVGPGDFRHDALAERLADGSGLFLDPDADGALSAEERDAGPVAAGDVWVPEGDPDDL